MYTHNVCIGKIRVYIRLRPLSKSEIERGCTEATAKDGMSDCMSDCVIPLYSILVLDMECVYCDSAMLYTPYHRDLHVLASTLYTVSTPHIYRCITANIIYIVCHGIYRQALSDGERCRRPTRRQEDLRLRPSVRREGWQHPD